MIRELIFAIWNLLAKRKEFCATFSIQLFFLQICCKSFRNILLILFNEQFFLSLFWVLFDICKEKTIFHGKIYSQIIQFDFSRWSSRFPSHF